MTANPLQRAEIRDRRSEIRGQRSEDIEIQARKAGKARKGNQRDGIYSWQPARPLSFISY